MTRSPELIQRRLSSHFWALLPLYTECRQRRMKIRLARARPTPKPEYADNHPSSGRGARSGSACSVGPVILPGLHESSCRWAGWVATEQGWIRRVVVAGGWLVQDVYLLVEASLEERAWVACPEVLRVRFVARTGAGAGVGRLASSAGFG